MIICCLFDIEQQTFAADGRRQTDEPLEHRGQSQIDAGTEPIGVLMELKCVLGSAVAVLHYYGRIGGTVLLGIFMLHSRPCSTGRLHRNH